MKYVILPAVMLLGLAAMPAHAAKYKCGCEESAKAGLQQSKDPKIECVETYKGYDKHVSIQESHLKIYVDSSNLVQGDKDANIRFRPRDGKCLERVADGNQEKVLWMGSHCSNSSYRDVGQFKLKESKEQEGQWMATYEARTSGKDYTGFLIYATGKDGKRYMQAACLENK
ncbi:MAG: hypothetical protein DIU62_000095 [Pseudomonadota bacterium]|jgi:hypothetical protein|nr:MAG: hypothetical protein DIU62_00885 [Pseudomonadota bacterium]